MINDFAFNGKGILKKGYGTRPAGVRVDGAAPRGFLRFLSLTAFQAEGCGGGFAANYKKSRPHPRHFDRSEAEWRNLPPSDGTGGITVGDLSAQSIMGSVSICSP